MLTAPADATFLSEALSLCCVRSGLVVSRACAGVSEMKRPHEPELSLGVVNESVLISFGALEGGERTNDGHFLPLGKPRAS